MTRKQNKKKVKKVVKKVMKVIKGFHSKMGVKKVKVK